MAVIHQFPNNLKHSFIMQYQPPQAEWQPKTSEWKPAEADPDSGYALPNKDYIPKQNNWTPRAESAGWKPKSDDYVVKLSQWKPAQKGQINSCWIAILYSLVSFWSLYPPFSDVLHWSCWQGLLLLGNLSPALCPLLLVENLPRYYTEMAK